MSYVTSADRGQHSSSITSCWMLLMHRVQNSFTCQMVHNSFTCHKVHNSFTCHRVHSSFNCHRVHNCPLLSYEFMLYSLLYEKATHTYDPPSQYQEITPSISCVKIQSMTRMDPDRHKSEADITTSELQLYCFVRIPTFGTYVNSFI